MIYMVMLLIARTANLGYVKSGRYFSPSSVEDIIRAGSAARLSYSDEFFDTTNAHAFEEDCTKKKARFQQGIHFANTGFRIVALTFDDKPDTLYIAFRGAKESGDLKLVWHFIKNKAAIFLGRGNTKYGNMLERNVETGIELIRTIVSRLKKQINFKNLVICGHSLGGYYTQKVLSKLNHKNFLTNIHISGHAFQAPGAFESEISDFSSHRYPLWIYLRKGDLCNCFRYLGSVLLFPGNSNFSDFGFRPMYPHRLKPFLEQLSNQEILPIAMLDLSEV